MMVHRFRFLTLPALAAALIALGIVSSGSAVSAAGAGNDAADIIPGRFIVVLQDGAPPADVLADHGLAAIHAYSAALNGFAAAVPPNQLADLQADPRVAAVEADRIEHILDQSLPTGIDRIETDKNPKADIDNIDDVRVNMDVAIIDTGIDAHLDLIVAGGQDFTAPGGGQDNQDSTGPKPDSFADTNGHGTHVAGTVGAKDNDFGVVGVAPGARVWAAKVCRQVCFTSDMIAGIDWVAAQKADYKFNPTTGINFASANMSISHPDDTKPCSPNTIALHLAICGLVDEGVVFVQSAGNDGRAKGAYPESMSVSALADFDGKAGGEGIATCRFDVDDTLADFSNFGPEVDIAAPGTCILSTWKSGGYNTISGTSMAAPHVAGAVALYLHANGLDPATDGAGVNDIEAAIIDAALPQGHVCGYTNEHFFSEGSDEPLLFVNSNVTVAADTPFQGSFGGNGSCEVAGAAAPVTDIAVTAVSAPASAVQEDVVSVDVTVENVGNQDVGSFDVTLEDLTAPVEIGTQPVASLAAGASTTLTYSWNTFGASIGSHTLEGSHNLADDDVTNDSATTTVTVNEPTGGDTVTITKAVYNSKKNGGQLKVGATSSLGGDAILTATFFYGPTEGGKAIMSYNAKKDKWSVTFDSGDGLTTKPDTVTVTSSLGGSHTSTVGGK